MALAMLAEQNFDIIEDMQTFKTDFKGAFLEFARNMESNFELLRKEAKDQFVAMQEELVKLSVKKETTDENTQSIPKLTSGLKEKETSENNPISSNMYI